MRNSPARGINVIGVVTSAEMFRSQNLTHRLPNGALSKVELHWYEAHGIGKRDLKIKRYLGGP
jgi:hypothetical protein